MNVKEQMKDIFALQTCVEHDLFCMLRENCKGHEPDELTVNGCWECSLSPVGYCVYHDLGDPAHNECLYCGEPEDRK